MRAALRFEQASTRGCFWIDQLQYLYAYSQFFYLKQIFPFSFRSIANFSPGILYLLLHITNSIKGRFSAIMSHDNWVRQSTYLYQLMISSYSIANNLLFKVVFFTAKSARQTTPNLIKNPRLTKRGLVQPWSRSYAYEVPQGTPNAHLYWNNTEQNKLRRKNYNANRLYKLGIKPIHDENGQPLNNRTIEEVLFELSSHKVIKASLGRTLINLKEIRDRFPETMSNQNREVVLWTLEQLDQRNLPSMNLYQFSTYCYYRGALGVAPTERLIFHTYKWIEGEVEKPTGKFRPAWFFKLMKYVFNQKLTENMNDILYKKKIEFKLFEDLEPMNKPLEELLPKLFTNEELRAAKKHPTFKIQNCRFLKKIPGGQALYNRLINA